MSTLPISSLMESFEKEPKAIILLQTWKVASQQCESYGWEESFTGVSMGWQASATSGSPTLATNLVTLETKYGISKVLELSRYFH
ncbi:hypothetical protein AVEN_139647-1 [Araneus ventricosus]|uniref:Uncharacterized protein n=1 Tax=Araneus ventricosus TaxID=182803 RepID=A0A4Y2FUV8_ARAVE|nr:hypothetical protein AVEN_139647-1 [Araneus ventricosus]